jgi:two-component system phosphate regulon sensor histidine kinase PhoR
MQQILLANKAELEVGRYRLLLAQIDPGRLTWLSPGGSSHRGQDGADAGAAGLLQASCGFRPTAPPAPVEIESTLILDAAGVPVSVVGVVRDLRARRELAAQQKKFASMLSHEFRTPLSTIDGAVQRLEMTGAHHDEATRKRYRKIQAAVDRMLAMLDEYLSPDRMASIGRERQPNEINPATLLESVVEQARLRRNPVLLRVDGLPQWVRCDPAGIRLCLEILVDNAIKYTEDNTPLELIGKKASEGGIEFLVRDRGDGIAEEELAQVFGKGFRGSKAAGVAGSGLGLYIARSIADVHGGSVSARNVSESGTEFRNDANTYRGRQSGLCRRNGRVPD